MDLDDIQHFLVTRTPALAARYEFLSFDGASAGKTWLAGVIDKVGTVSTVGTESPDARWVTVAFTSNGLRALGIDDAALATFPEEFRQGLAARAELLGITGAGHPEHWDAGLDGARRFTRSSSCSLAMSLSASAASGNTRTILRGSAVFACCRRSISRRCRRMANRASTSAISIG